MTTTPRPQPSQPTGIQPNIDQPVADRLIQAVEAWARSQVDLVTAAAEFADSPHWHLTGARTPAHWLASIADVEPCTAREWIRIGRQLQHLPAIADAFRSQAISYSKVRTLTRIANPENEQELIAIARSTSAANLRRALAVWFRQNSDPDELDTYHQDQRSMQWRLEPDGMTTFTLQLPPIAAGRLISKVTRRIMRTTPTIGTNQGWPTVSQQRADAIDSLLTQDSGRVDTEIVVHLRGDGSTLDDGTPVSENAIADLIPTAFISALLHDAKQNPIDATNRRRHPTRRQKRLVKERDRVCVDCGRADLLQYDHEPPFEQSEHTVTDELRLRCAPCHHERHKPNAA